MAQEMATTTRAWSVELDRNETRSLEWIGHRYTSGEVLREHSDDELTEPDPYGSCDLVCSVITLTEDTALAYLTALVEDNNNPGQIVPPCAGGPLARKLEGLYDRLADELDFDPTDHVVSYDDDQADDQDDDPWCETCERPHESGGLACELAQAERIIETE